MSFKPRIAVGAYNILYNKSIEEGGKPKYSPKEFEEKILNPFLELVKSSYSDQEEKVNICSETGCSDSEVTFNNVQENQEKQITWMVQKTIELLINNQANDLKKQQDITSQLKQIFYIVSTLKYNPEEEIPVNEYIAKLKKYLDDSVNKN